jgi:CxxC-x17-CxxC domain-containing protein
LIASAGQRVGALPVRELGLTVRGWVTSPCPAGTICTFLEASVSRFSDKVLVCRDCGKEFVFTAGEQEFYSARGFNEPTRCSDCRAARKTARNGGSTAAGAGMGTRSSSYGNREGGSTRGGSNRQMYKVTCAECGAETEVPFEPRTGRPVYCRDCFERRSGKR